MPGLLMREIMGSEQFYFTQMVGLRLFQLHDDSKAKCIQYFEFCTSQCFQSNMCPEFQFSSFISNIYPDVSLCLTQDDSNKLQLPGSQPCHLQSKPPVFYSLVSKTVGHILLSLMKLNVRVMKKWATVKGF